MLYWGRQGQLKSKLEYIFTLARASSPQIPFITDSELDWKYWKIIRKRSMVFFWPRVLLLGNPWPVSLCPSFCCHRAGDTAQPPVSRRMRMEESSCGRRNTLCWGFSTDTRLSQICLSPSACLPGQLVAFPGELMDAASSSSFFHLVFHFQGCRTCPPVTASSSAWSLPPGDGNSLWRAIGRCCELLSLLIEAC